jgi:hypothetical protein
LAISNIAFSLFPPPFSERVYASLGVHESHQFWEKRLEAQPNGAEVAARIEPDLISNPTLAI